MASNSNNPWLKTNSNKLRSYRSVRPPFSEHSTYGTSKTHQYTVPVMNLYSALSNRQELQPTSEVILSSINKHPSRSVTVKNRKYIRRSLKKLKIATNQHDHQESSHSRNITCKSEEKVKMRQTIFQL